MEHIWDCTCGHAEVCEPRDLQYGAVYQCHGCKQVWACVYPRAGGNAWIKVDASDVEFHDLLKEPTPEDGE